MFFGTFRFRNNKIQIQDLNRGTTNGGLRGFKYLADDEIGSDEYFDDLSKAPRDSENIQKEQEQLEAELPKGQDRSQAPRASRFSDSKFNIFEKY